MESSEFSDIQQTFPDAELLPVGGSTCDCYRVKLFGKLHFMKRLKPELRTDPRYVSALQKEFETGYRLDHPHLVRYVSKGDDYLMTEYVDGLTLGAFVEENPAYFKSAQSSNRFLTQLLEVVGYLHQHQIVHLDLKPSNILITRIGHDVKLADLGYCYTDTYTDTMGRTDKYAAPEQMHGEQVDARTDIFAIGKLMESLPCHHIYNKVIARCTAPSPSDRYQTIEELQNALKPSSHFNLIVMGVLLISMVLWGGYLMTQNHEDRPLDSKQDHDSVPVILPAHTSEQIDTARPKKANNNAPSTNSSITEEQLSNQKITFRELTDLEKKEIRNITLSIVQPVYQQEIEPIVDRVIRGDYDSRQSYITDSLDRAFVLANEKVFAGLRQNSLKSKYPDAIEEDINNESLYAIGDAMNYYQQKVFQYFHPGSKLPPNPFAK